ncbi:MAG TPA: DUF4193 family protein [Actinomycetota bacterium]
MTEDDLADIDTTDDDAEPIDDEPLEDLEPTADDLAENVVTPEPGLENVESIQDLLAKQESREEAETADEEDEVVAPTPVTDDRLEAGESRVVPMQATEFMCKNCFLVKHRSQLADKKKMLCRDCA